MSARKSSAAKQMYWSFLQSGFVPIEVDAAKAAMWTAYDAVSKQWPDIEPEAFGALVMREWLPEVTVPSVAYNDETPF